MTTEAIIQQLRSIGEKEVVKEQRTIPADRTAIKWSALCFDVANHIEEMLYKQKELEEEISRLSPLDEESPWTYQADDLKRSKNNSNLMDYNATDSDMINLLPK